MKAISSLAHCRHMMPAFLRAAFLENGPSKRAKVPEEDLLELKRMLPFFYHCAVSHTCVVFNVLGVVEHVFEDPDWEIMRASVNQALRDMVSQGKKNK